MAQEIVANLSGKVSKLSMPSPRKKVMNNVYWGDCTFIFTPAYWKTLAWMDESAGATSYRLGETLTEEITACLLGGYGIPSEVGLAAFSKIKKCGILESDYPVTAKEIYSVLSMPLDLRNKKVHYRFAKQKAQYLSNALKKLNEYDAPTADHQAFRQWLLEFDGIGYKTASWITRNWLQSDEVCHYRYSHSPGRKPNRIILGG